MATLQDYLGITKLRDAWPKWKANVVAVNNQVINHVAGSADKHLTSDITNDSEEAGTTTADAINTNKVKVATHIAGTADKHSAQDITYTGDFVGKTEVKAALDQAKTEIDTIVVNASIDPEVAFARDSAVKSKTFTTLDDRLEEDEQDLVSYKAETTKQIGVSCTSLGMIKNDALEASNNYTLLTESLLLGTPIMIDGPYYISTDGQTNLTENVILLGVKGVAKLIFISPVSYWYLEGQSLCYADNVEFVGIDSPANERGTHPDIFKSGLTAYIKKFDVNNCIFTDSIRLMRHAPSTTTDPTVTQFGYETFTVTKNRIINNNTRTSFIYIADCPCDVLNISNNYVHNFDYIICHAGVTNGITYGIKVVQSKKLLIMNDNVFKCDDDWWGATGLNAYYTPIVFEGEQSIFRGNHTEGLHTEGSAAIYDGYFSSNHHTYQNNVWLNNVCFLPGKDPNTNMLMKSKGSTTNGIRYCSNNKFRVDEAYSVRLGKDPELSLVTLYDAQSNMDKYEMTDNDIEVYKLILPRSSNAIKKLTISNNRFNCYKIGGYLAYYNILAAADAEYGDAYVEIENNTISSINTTPEATANDLWCMSMLHTIDNSVATKRPHRITIKGNVFKGFMQYQINKVICDDLVLTNNVINVSTITNVSTVSSMIFLSDIRNSLLMEGNLIKSDGFPLGDRSVIGRYEEMSNIKTSGIYTTTGYGLQAFQFELLRYDPSVLPKRITLEIKAKSSLGFQHFYLTFEYGYDAVEDRNYVTFIKAVDGLETTVYLNKNDGYTVGEWTKLKIYDLSTNVVGGMDYAVVNNDSGVQIRYIAGYASTERVVYEITKTITNV